jgi:hypothetical protein
MADLPPAARQIFLGLGRIGYKVLSAAVHVGLKEVRTLGEELTERVKRGEEAAEKMSRGEPYRRDDGGDNGRRE